MILKFIKKDPDKKSLYPNKQAQAIFSGKIKKGIISSTEF